jgi:hypothetical protein
VRRGLGVIALFERHVAAFFSRLGAAERGVHLTVEGPIERRQAMESKGIEVER